MLIKGQQAEHVQNDLTNSLKKERTLVADLKEALAKEKSRITDLRAALEKERVQLMSLKYVKYFHCLEFENADYFS